MPVVGLFALFIIAHIAVGWVLCGRGRGTLRPDQLATGTVSILHDTRRPTQRIHHPALHPAKTQNSVEFLGDPV